MNNFQTFFDSTKKGFYNYLIALTKDSDMADDIFQETYFKVYKKYKGELSPALLYKIGKNLFINEYNRSKKYTNSEQIMLKYDHNSDNAIEANKLLSLLDDEEKQLFLMSAVDGMKYEEISKSTGLSVSNIKVKILRARKKIKEIMKGG